ncbi:MAG: isoleucine--tRNA ligase [Chloroflexi bacterium]|nr:isoleucine--tRNA ligase [Chloroflexota bacterium]
MFKPVGAQVNYAAQEENILQYWKSHGTFEKSMQLREKGERYVFYEGPPTANGRPGIHHVLARIFKDVFPRYHTMKGKFVRRKGGWDTHGLPVELEVEKKIGSNGKQDIEKYGIAEFNRLCRQSVWEYVQEWEKLTDRIGFWVDTDHAYITYDNNYIESGWHILKTLWEQDLLFKDYKVTMHCPRCSTSLADHEVALGFRDNVDDPSVYVKFRAADGPYAGAYFVAYTTTPWTLPANVALALKGDADYALVQSGDERYLVASARVHDLFGEHGAVLEAVAGSALVGTRYENLFTGVPGRGDTPDLSKAYRVVADETASVDEGAGMVHIAPAYGDLDVGRRHDLPTLFSVDLNGHLMPELGAHLGAGKFFKEADKDIARDLRQRGLLLKEGRVHHSYPFCWRCDSPLLYYAKSSWYIRTTAVKKRLVEANGTINWFPGHIQSGRFGNWLENNVDWALSRERYWGTPLPVWQCETCGQYDCMGSVAELRARASNASAVDWSQLDLHRPWVDALMLTCGRCGGTMTRVPDVIDCWFDSGAMPFAQWHYPFEQGDMFEEQFPADFICEAIDQTRGWFYSLHALGVLLKDSPVYKNCVTLGLVLDEKGNKMSKSRGNVVDPWKILASSGADALRWYLFRTTSLGNPYRFSESSLTREVVSGLFNTLWNTYSFFVTYANIDGWQPGEAQPAYSALDRWILSELQVLVRDVDAALAAYDVTSATRDIEEFVERLSNWYVRRSRRRFWKAQADADKRAAYAALYECLVTLSKLMAPFTPFLAESLYQNLVRTVDSGAPESVHHCDYPAPQSALVDESLMADTRLVMRLASLGLAARKQAGLKVRQPLAEAMVVLPKSSERDAMQALADQLMEEWNVKRVEFAGGQSGVAELALNPLPAKLGPKFGKEFPRVRQALIANPADYAPALQHGESVTVTLDGQEFTVNADEVEVKLMPRHGWTVSGDASYAVALSTELTDSLRREGVARELVRQFNDLRKSAGLRVEEMMRATWQGSEAIADALSEFGPYVMKETLAVELARADAPHGASVATVELDEGTVTLSVRTIGMTAAVAAPMKLAGQLSAPKAPAGQIAAPAEHKALAAPRKAAKPVARKRTTSVAAKKPSTSTKRVASSPRKGAKAAPQKPAGRQPAAKKAPSKPGARRATKTVVRKPAVKKPVLRKRAAKKPATRKPARKRK